MISLEQMLEDYRNGERGLPSYEGLCRVVSSLKWVTEEVRNTSLEEAVKVCEGELLYPGDDAGVDGQLNEAIERIRALIVKPGSIMSC